MRIGGKFLKRGFTLVETVVTIGIISSLAAVIYPTVVKQFDAADPTRIQNDLKNLQTAVETFNVNVKAFPGDLDDLTNVITTADSGLTTASSALFTATQVSLWQGPYVDFAESDAATEQLRPTGYAVSILDSFVCYDTGNNTFGTSEGSKASGLDTYKCPGSSGQKFLAFQIKGLVCNDANANFAALNALFDGTSEGTNAETLGRVRCAVSGTSGITSDIVYFLATPLT
jgi:prepilin-type N-terminal cleavage/methylation domain-containing protein